MRTIKQDPHLVAAKLRRVSRLRPTLAFVLGSGYDSLIPDLEVDSEIPYRKLPGFPAPKVSGHPGKLLIGHLGSTPVIVLSGRAHFYEGHDLATVTFPIRVLAACQVTDVLLTNAAGGVSARFVPGDLMILRDHINFMGASPLRGTREHQAPTRFVDLTDAYDRRLRTLLLKAGKACGLRLRTGVYCAVSGPNYETPAEVLAFRALGADSVGMSTVPEVIVARHQGMRVAGLSCITNLAAGRTRRPLSHEEVLATARKFQARTRQLLRVFAELYHRQPASPLPGCPG